MKILIPSTPDYANWLCEVVEAAETKKGESANLWDMIDWFEKRLMLQDMKWEDKVKLDKQDENENFDRKEKLIQEQLITTIIKYYYYY